MAQKSIVDIFGGDRKKALDTFMNLMAARLLINLATDYMREAVEELEKHGIHKQKGKELYKNATKWFDLYDKHMMNMLPTQNLSIAFLKDFDELRSIINGFIIGHNEIEEESDKDCKLQDNDNQLETK